VEQKVLMTAFVELAGALVDGADGGWRERTVEHWCALVGVDMAALIIDDQGVHEVAASTNVRAETLGRVQLHLGDGPGVDCLRSREVVSCSDLRRAGERWPRFSAAAAMSGFRAVQVLPMERGTDLVGAVNLFHARPRTLTEAELAVAGALADLTAIGILHERNARRYRTRIEQLQTALDTRVIIEQAKGVLAERCRIGTERAFELLRDHARRNNVRLHDLALDIVDGGLDPVGRSQQQGRQV
jgi:GAF domain-containing protein